MSEVTNLFFRFHLWQLMWESKKRWLDNNKSQLVFSHWSRARKREGEGAFARSKKKQLIILEKKKEKIKKEKWERKKSGGDFPPFDSRKRRKCFYLFFGIFAALLAFFRFVILQSPSCRLCMLERRDERRHHFESNMQHATCNAFW